ncbi:Sapep family Mn(2+)-dependent dipeptidase [uncultured Sphaerochaeta sp.]|uniref:Sapep family Mn(2+)-dependent dipeptidase n=1 Tax=uncultured Sphaerochaeta sp. TaxID=886478 RepID=UPI002A0A94C6|nr:Sapep family Mn(2+)-dependent dipeptidase [uncultured Sphaerochaeta sp.]
MQNKEKLWWDNHFSQMLGDLKALIAIPSISQENKETPDTPYGKACLDVLDFIGELGAGYGFSAKNCDNQCMILKYEGSIQTDIGIFSHLDVVPVGPGWSYDPFIATTMDDCIIGRGSGDNKGPAIAVLYALMYLKETGWKPKHTISHFFGVNEECGMKDIQYYVKNYPMPVFSLVPDVAFPVCHGEKGVLELDCEFSMSRDSSIRKWESGVASNAVPALCVAEIRVDYASLVSFFRNMKDIEIRSLPDGYCCIKASGIATHAAFPEGSVNAQTRLASALLEAGFLKESDIKLMKAIVACFSDYHGSGIGVPYEDDVSGKLTHVAGYSRYDRKTGKAFSQNINIRYTVTSDFKTMIGAIEKKLSDSGFRLVSYHDSAPMYVDENLSLIGKLTQISKEVTGLDLSPYVMGGGTYARKLKNAVGFGPGIPGGNVKFGADRGHGHQPDEYVAFDTLEKCFMAYVSAIPEIDSSLESGETWKAIH